MLVYQAIGDAYGAAFEFVDKSRWPDNNAQTYYTHPDISLGGGRYTDDVQMSIAVLETMLGTSRSAYKQLTKEEFAFAFFNQYKLDPRPGYSSGLTMLLDSATDQYDFFKKLGGNSTRSGAVMRSAVVGMLPNVEDVLAVSKTQCSVTHDNPQSILLSQAVSVATHFLIHHVGSRADIFDYIKTYVGPDTQFDVQRTEWASIEAIDCTQNAFTAWYNSRSATEVLINAVAPGGDTDTVASIAMGLAWADTHVLDDLPLELTNGLETGKYGFPLLHDLSAMAYQKFVRD